MDSASPCLTVCSIVTGVVGSTGGNLPAYIVRERQ